MYISISLVTVDKVSQWDESNEYMFKEVLDFLGNVTD